MEKQVEKGLTPEQVKFTTSLPVLRDASVQPMAWEKCTVKEFNLGGPCLTGRTIKAAYREYYTKDKTFRDEIEAKIGPAAASDMEEILDLEPDEELDLEEDLDDDSGVPLSRVVYDAVGLDMDGLDARDQNRYCAAANSVIGENGRLQSGAVTENIWAYGDNGELFTVLGNQ
ncbi:hypothetical protein H0H93_014474 [Arthromyces matolae]|nr:hypothetical protein H0H93_014474 [Arthromyces matolae]